MTEATARRKVRAWAAERGCEVTRRETSHGWGDVEIEVIAPSGKRFDDGDEGLTGLLADSWTDAWDRIEQEGALIEGRDV